MNSKLRALAICCLFLFSTTVMTAASSCVRAIDFRNFSYPDSPVAGKPPSETILRDGSHHCQSDPGGKSGVFLRSVTYDDLMGDNEKAIVVLYNWGGGNTFSLIVYIYGCKDGSPTLLFMNEYAEARSIRVRHHKLVVAAPSWNWDDPHCCPSYMVTYYIAYGGSSNSSFHITKETKKRLRKPY